MYFSLKCTSSAVFPLRCALNTRQFAQSHLILAHFQHSKFNAVYIYTSHREPFHRSERFTVCVSALLRSCMCFVRNKTNICSVYNFLIGNTALLIGKCIPRGTCTPSWEPLHYSEFTCLWLSLLSFKVRHEVIHRDIWLVWWTYETTGVADCLNFYIKW